MRRVYLDACSIIYLVEAASPFHDLIVERILRERHASAVRLITSRLSRLECRIRPLRSNDSAGLAIYDRFFRTSLQIIELNADVIECGTALRAEHNFATPDALHLASAIVSEADIFLTGDASLERCTRIKVEVLRLS